MSNAQNEQIINQNFEIWGSYTLNGITIDTAKNWINYTIIDGGIFGDILVRTAEKSTDVSEGNFAIKMSTLNNSGIIIPGLMQLGEYSITQKASFNISGGEKFSSKPLGFNAAIKYSPAVGDTGFVFCYMTKWNGNAHDTIAVSIYPLFDSIKNYIQIQAPFIYKQATDSICDTINIIFSSSNIFSPKIGSTLFVDDFSLSYTKKVYSTIALPATDTGTNSFTANWIKSPNSAEYFLDVAYDSLFTNFLSGYNSKLVSFKSPKDAVDEYTISQIVIIPSKTNYFYRVRVKYGDTAVSENSNIIAVHYYTPLKVKELSDFKDFRINNKLLILFNIPLNSTIQIFDINGQNLYSEKNFNETISIPFTHSGIYILKIISTNKIQTLKFKIN